MRLLAHRQAHFAARIGSSARPNQSAIVCGRRRVAMASAKDPTNSFILHFDIPGAPAGPLAGRTAAVKDMYDVKGYPTGFGNPTWLETHPAPAAAHAPAVQALLDAGARLVGKTHMDELAFSLNGENAHYGTPANVAAPGRVPGGSSSGSAAAVAAKQADIGLGSDTGGSVRVPASYCGLWGIRPTHGRISLESAAPLAPSFDTVGWFARGAAGLRAAGQALLPAGSANASAPLRPGGVRWLVARDAFELALPETSKAIYDALSGDRFAAVQSALGSPTDVDIAAAGVEGASELTNGLKSWMGVFREAQAFEVSKCHTEWLRAAKPALGPGIKERFEWAATITPERHAAAEAARQRIRAHVDALLGDDGVLALPTAPGPAVPLNTPGAELEDWRTRLLSLTCIAGLTGLPQVTVPLATVGGLPVGLSLLGPRGSDEALMALAERVAAAAGVGSEAAAAPQAAAV